MPLLTRKERHAEMVQACAIAHGRGSGMSLAELEELILEDGLPARAERERIKAERLAGDDTASPSEG